MDVASETFINEAFGVPSETENLLGVSLDDPPEYLSVARDPSVMQLERKMVSDLFEAVRLRDPYLGPHMGAVSQLSCQVGSEMGVSGEPLELLCSGALLHDVGKILIPDAILHKPGPLNRNEYEIMKRHTVLGAGILSRKGLPGAAPMAKYHHERFDGEGYPGGLKKGEIPLAARIICVTDALDSMVRNKIYQRGVSMQTALEEIVRNSETQFDPQVVAALVEVLRQPNGHRMNPLS